MNQVTSGIRGILSNAAIYELWSRMVGGERERSIFIRNHVRPEANARVLDLGCGTGELLNHLPSDVRYLGIDISSEYIARAEERLGERGEFCIGDATVINSWLGEFDLVIAFGVLHHLDDKEVRALFRNSASALTSSGRIVTVDPVFTSNQSYARRALMARDRGRHVRTREAYVALANFNFMSVQSYVYHDLLRIPYSHCILEAQDNRQEDA